MYTPLWDELSKLFQESDDHKNQQPVTLLIVEDDESASELYCSLLQKEAYNILLARTAEEALMCLERCREPLVIFSDINLANGPNGIELCKLIKRLPLFTVVIFASGDPTFKKAAIKVGATFLLKPLEPDDLLDYLATAANTVRDHIRSAVDDKTGFLNEWYFNRMLDQELSRARRTRSDVSMLALDVDDFKLVNDTYGHPVGDRALSLISDCLRKCLRGYDTPLRLGDEFFVILPRTGAHEAMDIAQRVEAMVSAASIELGPDLSVRVMVSVGYATRKWRGIRSNLRWTADRLIAAADKAMYQAKRRRKREKRLAMRQVA
jgi:diguanylate cyclase (GGDEF)-like protein